MMRNCIWKSNSESATWYGIECDTECETQYDIFWLPEVEIQSQIECETEWVSNFRRLWKKFGQISYDSCSQGEPYDVLKI